ncbi:MAG: GNAT family N-acetyltransferase [Bacteroidota bacterium]
MEHKGAYKFISGRLGFRAWNENDYEPFAAMNSNESVMEYFPKALSKEESNNFIDKINTMFKEHGYGLYAVDELQTNEFIGFIGFSHPSFDLGIPGLIEIGWRIREEKWNQGFATEGAKTCLQFGFDQLNFKDIYSFTSKVNTKSERVMQKIGMNKVKEFEHPKIKSGSHLKTHVLYKIGNL